MRGHSDRASRPLWRITAYARAQDGFTLIEIMVSALLVVIIAAGVGEALIAGSHYSALQQRRSQAEEIAQQDQERLRGLSPKQLSALSTAETYPVTVANATYTVSSQATLESATGGDSCTDGTSGAAAYYHTVSTVSWSDSAGSHSVNVQSIITPASGGTLLTQVVDQTNTPLGGANVTAIGQSSGGDQETGTTSSEGCVIFSGLAIDNYTVQVADGGYVDKNGNAPLSDTATVTGSGTSRPTNSTEMIGQAGLINASLSTTAYALDNSPSTSTVSGQAAPSVSFMGTGSTTSMSAFKSVAASPAGSTQTAFTLQNLFPFYFTGPPGNYANNYQVWAGACQAEEPPAGQAGTTATVGPGSNQSLSFMEPSLFLIVNYNNGSTNQRVVPTDVHLTFTGGGCTDKWTEAIRSTGNTSNDGVLTNPGVPFASSATSGATASASDLTGTLQACVDYYTTYKSSKVYFEGSTPTFTTSYASPTSETVNLTTSSTQGKCP